MEISINFLTSNVLFSTESKFVSFRTRCVYVEEPAAKVELRTCVCVSVLHKGYQMSIHMVARPHKSSFYVHTYLLSRLSVKERHTMPTVLRPSKILQTASNERSRPGEHWSRIVFRLWTFLIPSTRLQVSQLCLIARRKHFYFLSKLSNCLSKIYFFLRISKKLISPVPMKLNLFNFLISSLNITFGRFSNENYIYIRTILPSAHVYNLRVATFLTI